MKRAFHILTIFDTYLLIRQEHGLIVPDQLIGYTPPDGFERALSKAEARLQPLMEMEASTTNACIMPTNAQLRSASAKEIEQWARHLDSGGKVPPPVHLKCNPSKHLNDEQQKDIQELRKAMNAYRQFTMVRSIVYVLVSSQQRWLQSGAWLDKTRLTIRQIARHIDDFSEKSVERAVKCLYLKLDGRLIAASDLLCTSIQPSLCRAILQLPNKEQGAPSIKHALKKIGIDVSCRCVGMALETLRMNALL